MESGDLKELIRHMNFEVCEQNYILFNEGETGDKFYIIYEGRVGVSIKDKGIVSELKKGDSFGELSLLFAQPRLGTAIALEKTELISLSRESYEKIIKVLFNQKNHSSLGLEHFKFLQKIPLFFKMSHVSAKYLTQIISFQKFAAG